MKPISEIYPIMHRGGEKVVVVFHQKPDADAMGSGLGLKWFLEALGHEVTVISPTNWANYLAWMPGATTVIDFEQKTSLATDITLGATFIFCLDFNTASRTKRMAPVLQQAAATKVLIDHHQQPDEAFFDYGISNTAKSSTAEMVYDFIVESGGTDFITKPIAECLYAGVMTDTGSFRFPITTGDVHRMVGVLIDKGAQQDAIHEHLFDNYLENRLRFFGQVMLNRMEVIYEYNTVLLSVPKSDIIKYSINTGDTEGLVNLPFAIQGIKLVAIVIDRDEERKWSFRSKGNVDVNVLARTWFNGGGHKNAAGGSSHDSLEKTVEKFYEVLPQLKDELA